MVYIGSKARLSKYLIPIIQKIIDDKNILTYIEPFVGGANIIDKIKCSNRIGYDLHEGLIGIYKGVQNGFIPPLHITEEQYYLAKKSTEEPLRSYIGFAGSYATKWWGGFARSFKADRVTPRDVYNERTNNFLKQIPRLKNIKFDIKSFEEIKTENSLIYCDPPYAGTTKYRNIMDYSLFWLWVREQSIKNIVLVSEFSAPIDFKVLWEKERTILIDKNRSGLKKIERLFTLNNL